MSRLFLLFPLLVLVACAGRQPTPTHCPALYVLLPGNFVIDLAAGSKVLLDPAVQEIALFCSPQEAKDTLKEAAPESEWAIYSIDGNFTEVAEIRAQGDYRLTRPVQVLDWIPLGQ